MKEKNPDALRITNQFRRDGGMVYDLRGDGSRITIVITQRFDVERPDQWHVQAQTGSAPETTAFAEVGSTRVDALRAVGKSWNSHLLANGLPHFDWDAIEQALRAVKAV
jgi:hypothetical protein